MERTQLGLVPACPSLLRFRLPGMMDTRQSRDPRGNEQLETDTKNCPEVGKIPACAARGGSAGPGWRLEGEVTVCDNPGTFGRRESRAGCTSSSIPAPRTFVPVEGAL